MAITAPPAGIFKAYDIRGVYGEELDAETAHLIGRAFARVLARLRGKATSELRVGLGRDMRLSGPEMAAGVRAGLVEEGVTVVDAGQIATEMSYFLVGSRELDGGAPPAPRPRRRCAGRSAASRPVTSDPLPSAKFKEKNRVATFLFHFSFL